MEKDIVIRASSLPAFADCQLRAVAHSAPHLFVEHGFDLAPPRSNVGALVGSGLHGAGEVGLNEKMNSGTVAPASVLEDAAVAAFDLRWDEEVRGVVEIVMDGETPTRDVGRRALARMAVSYREGVLQDAEPVVVESRIKAVFRPGMILSGQSDLLHLDAAAGGKIVRDLKTGRRKQSAMKHGPQIGAYSALFGSIGFTTTGAMIDFIKREALGKPQPDVVSEPLSIEAAERMAHSIMTDFFGKIEGFARNGDPGLMIPNPSSQLCSAKFCRLHGKNACPATGVFS